MDAERLQERVDGATDGATIVTGGGGAIGRELCLRLAGRGRPVVAVDLTEESLAWTTGLDVVPYVADITTEAGNAGMVETALAHFRRVRGAALNAGVHCAGGIEELPLDDLDRAIAVNFRGVILGLRALVPAMRDEGGSIVLTSSISALTGESDNWAYSGTKAALLGVVRALSVELAPARIRINAVCPGPTYPGMTRQAPYDPAMAARVAAAVPLERWAQGADQAAAMAFLLSQDADYITGVALPVDGGITAASSFRLSAG